MTGTQSGTSDMRGRMNQMFEQCQAAQTALEQGEALLRQSMRSSSSTSTTGTAGTSDTISQGDQNYIEARTHPALSQADQKFSEARTHLTKCNAMLSEMRSMHHGMSGGAMSDGMGAGGGKSKYGTDNTGGTNNPH